MLSCSCFQNTDPNSWYYQGFQNEFYLWNLTSIYYADYVPIIPVSGGQTYHHGWITSTYGSCNTGPAFIFEIEDSTGAFTFDLNNYGVHYRLPVPLRTEIEYRQAKYNNHSYSNTRNIYIKDFFIDLWP